MPKHRFDTYSQPQSKELSLKTLLELFNEQGANRFYIKALAPNDNSKNQIYFGGDFSAVNVIPASRWEVYKSASKKDKLKKNAALMRGLLNFSWVDGMGAVYPAPEAKLILYPQYPEIRFSGFLKGSEVNASEWMSIDKSGRNPGRFLILGVSKSRQCFGFLAVPGSTIARELEQLGYREPTNSLKRLESPSGGDKSSRIILLEELKRIHLASPIAGKKLNRAGMVTPYRARNGGGYTLEAEFGISPNGEAGPDFMGWEVKSFRSSVTTLLTPEPSGGVYKDEGFNHFISQYGYPDRSGIKNRMNFGGVHRCNEKHLRTKLTLELSGYAGVATDLDLSGAICLTDANGTIAASWSFQKLVEHWNKKHARAAYVPCSKAAAESNAYNYGNLVKLGEGTDFLNFIAAVYSGAIYYDPGMKLEDIHLPSPKPKKRSQFRITHKHLHQLYGEFVQEDVLDY